MGRPTEATGQAGSLALSGMVVGGGLAHQSLASASRFLRHHTQLSQVALVQAGPPHTCAPAVGAAGHQPRQGRGLRTERMSCCLPERRPPPLAQIAGARPDLGKQLDVANEANHIDDGLHIGLAHEQLAP